MLYLEGKTQTEGYLGNDAILYNYIVLFLVEFFHRKGAPSMS